jgi:hypothetical protein
MPVVASLAELPGKSIPARLLWKTAAAGFLNHPTETLPIITSPGNGEWDLTSSIG